MDKHPKILFFSQRFPPSVGGTPTVMRNLCEALPAENISVISMDDASSIGTYNCAFSYHRFRQPSNRLMRRLDPQFHTQIPFVIKSALKVYNQEDLDMVVGVFPNPCFLISAWRLAKKCCKPFFPYFMDTWEETRSRFKDRLIAKIFEPIIFRDAKRIFMLSKPLVEYYTRKWPSMARKIVCIPHCLPRDWAALKEAKPTHAWKADNELLIVYTGQVYGATADPIENLIKTLSYISDLNPKVIISSPDSESQLLKHGIHLSDRVELVKLENQKQVRELQAQADILFNPVSFNGWQNVQVQTLFPTKSIEYLAAGKPMLIHGPSRTSYVDYAKAKGFAIVVDRKDDRVLSNAIRQMYALPEPDKIKLAREAQLQLHNPENVAACFLQNIVHCAK